MLGGEILVVVAFQNPTILMCHMLIITGPSASLIVSRWHGLRLRILAFSFSVGFRNEWEFSRHMCPTLVFSMRRYGEELHLDWHNCFLFNCYLFWMRFCGIFWVYVGFLQLPLANCHCQNVGKCGQIELNMGYGQK